MSQNLHMNYGAIVAWIFDFLRFNLRKFQDQLVTECFHLETTFSMSFKGEKRPQTDSFGRLSVLNSKRT